MWLESGKPEPIEVELPPLPEDQPAKKKALPMKGKACEVRLGENVYCEMYIMTTCTKKKAITSAD